MSETKAIDDITRNIIGGAIAVHDVFGPGLFEATYIPPFVWELQERGLQSQTRVSLDIEYRGKRLKNAYCIDILVADLVVVEVKAVDKLAPVHLAQLITYVRLANKPAGLLINFNEKRLVDGVRRVLNDHPRKKPSVSAVPSEHEHR
jgi:GxxExxY protein